MKDSDDAIYNTLSHLCELVSRTAMLVALFEAGDASHCGCFDAKRGKPGVDHACAQRRN
jgi:hypothetical protein